MKSYNLNNFSDSNFNYSNVQHKKKKSKLKSPKKLKSKNKELSLDDLNNENDFIESLDEGINEYLCILTSNGKKKNQNLLRKKIKILIFQK